MAQVLPCLAKCRVLCKNYKISSFNFFSKVHCCNNFGRAGQGNWWPVSLGPESVTGMTKGGGVPGTSRTSGPHPFATQIEQNVRRTSGTFPQDKQDISVGHAHRRRRKFTPKIHANLVVQPCISFLRFCGRRELMETLAISCPV